MPNWLDYQEDEDEPAPPKRETPMSKLRAEFHTTFGRPAPTILTKALLEKALEGMPARPGAVLKRRRLAEVALMVASRKRDLQERRDLARQVARDSVLAHREAMRRSPS